MPCGWLVYAANAHSWMVFAIWGAPLTKNFPGSHSRSCSLTSRRCAAIFFALSRILREARSEEHTSELQSRPHLVCRLLLEKKKYVYTQTSLTIDDRVIVH